MKYFRLYVLFMLGLLMAQSATAESEKSEESCPTGYHRGTIEAIHLNGYGTPGSIVFKTNLVDGTHPKWANAVFMIPGLILNGKADDIGKAFYATLLTAFVSRSQIYFYCEDEYATLLEIRK